MDRRKFAKISFFSGITAGSALLIAGCGVENDHAAAPTSDAPLKSYKAFAYYEGLSPQGRRSSRTDGTYHNMPCIKESDIGEAPFKVYNFWHSHSSQHTFTLTAEDFALLATGDDVEVFTNVVDGHRHAVRIEASKACQK